MGAPDRKPQELSRHVRGIYLPSSLFSYHIPSSLFEARIGITDASLGDLLLELTCPSAQVL